MVIVILPQQIGFSITACAQRPDSGHGAYTGAHRRVVFQRFCCLALPGARGRKMPPLMPEFVAQSTVQAATMPPLDAKGCLLHAFQGVPKHSKLFSFAKVGDKLGNGEFTITCKFWHLPITNNVVERCMQNQTPV